MSRIPVPGNAATDRDVQYLMKIKRRVMFDENRSSEDKKKLSSLLVETITMLLNKRGLEIAPPPPSKPAAQANGKVKKVG